MRTVLAIVAAALLASATTVFAQDAHVETLYLGVGLGDFSIGIENLSDVNEVNVDFDSDKSAERNDFATHAEGFAPSGIRTLPLGPVEVFARARIL